MYSLRLYFNLIGYTRVVKEMPASKVSPDSMAHLVKPVPQDLPVQKETKALKDHEENQDLRDPRELWVNLVYRDNRVPVGIQDLPDKREAEESQVTRDRVGHKDNRVTRDHRDRKERREPPVTRERSEIRVSKENKDTLETKEWQETPVPSELQVNQVARDRLDTRVQLEPPVSGDPPGTKDPVDLREKTETLVLQDPPVHL